MMLVVTDVETAILARVRALLPGGGALTDDCGAVPAAAPGTVLLATTDLLEEGIHFRRDWHPPELLGRKLLAVNLSDLDASGAEPLGFLLTLALPADTGMDWIEAFLQGLAGAARQEGVPVIGGDTVGSRRGLSLGLTAVGSARRRLDRAGLIPGDAVYVDAVLGRSAAGQRKLEAGLRWDGRDPDLRAHLDPAPNLGLGVRLAARPDVHACMDLSDGLAADLPRLAEASGVTLRLPRSIQGADLDTPEGAALLAAGEDYARCFGSTAPQGELEAALGLPLHRVATVEARGASPLIHYDGDPLRVRGFDHFAPP
ncbi:MAG: thiamine-phosphate kinase [Holophagaceae bacterium]